MKIIDRLILLLRFYRTIGVLCVGSIVTGGILIYMDNNVFENLNFPINIGDYWGIGMIIIASLKLLSLKHYGRRARKYLLILMTLLWLTLLWGYLYTGTITVGAGMSLTLTLLCFSELWRGDFDE